MIEHLGMLEWIDAAREAATTGTRLTPADGNVPLSRDAVLRAIERLEIKRVGVGTDEKQPPFLLLVGCRDLFVAERIVRDIDTMSGHIFGSALPIPVEPLRIRVVPLPDAWSGAPGAWHVLSLAEDPRWISGGPVSGLGTAE